MTTTELPDWVVMSVWLSFREKVCETHDNRVAMQAALTAFLAILEERGLRIVQAGRGDCYSCRGWPGEPPCDDCGGWVPHHETPAAPPLAELLGEDGAS